MLFLLTENTRYTNVLQLIGTLLVFIIVIAACYFVTRFVGGKQLAQQKNSNFDVLDTMRLAQNRYLQIVQVGRRYFVIAISKDNISLISELQEEDIVCRRQNRPNQAGFQDILANFRKKKAADVREDAPAASEEKIDDFKENR